MNTLTSHEPASTQLTPAPAPSAALNGLDPAAITGAVAAVTANPALAAVAFRARTSWQGRLRSITEVDGYELGGQRFERRHRITSDEPLEVFGTDRAPNPQDLLLAALNACMMVGFVLGATVRGIELVSLQIESSLSLDLRGAFGSAPNVPAGAECIRYVVRVKGNGSREQFEEIHREVMATSPNRFHLATPISLAPELVIE